MLTPFRYLMYLKVVIDKKLLKFSDITAVFLVLI